MELLLVRHGLPERSDHSSDPPLSPVGWDQARRVARWLGRERIGAVVSSPMKRAMQTAEPFAAEAGHAVAAEPGIVEFGRDSRVYIPMEELKRDDYAAWTRFVSRSRGEQIAAFHATVVEALECVVARHPGQSVAVFCHGGVINVWTAYVLGMAPRLFFEPDYTSVHRYLCASTGQRNLVSLNERAHLRHDIAEQPG
jgi:probable phosphoglycerate mutase